MARESHVYRLGPSAVPRAPLALPHVLPPDLAHRLDLPVDGAAEARLIRQGHLGALRSGGAVWPVARLGHALVAVGLPAGRACASELVADLALAARHANAFPCLYKADPRLAAAARRSGMSALAIAEEAVIDPARFAPERPVCAGLRRKLRKAHRSGVTITEAGRMPPLAEMAAVNAAWASAHGGERGFSVGRFAEAYVSDQGIWIARDSGGSLAAFVTVHRSGCEWTLDLMRYALDAPDGTMQALIVHVVAAAAEAGVSRLSLAAAPLAPTAPCGAVARGVAALMRWQGGAGLRQFKLQFDPQWERRYLVAAGPASLARAGAAIARAIRSPGPLPDTRTGAAYAGVGETSYAPASKPPELAA